MTTSIIFRDVTPCILAEHYCSFGGTQITLLPALVLVFFVIYFASEDGKQYFPSRSQ
jgi:hypothetical protein